jgi:hypothetical protein
VLRGKAPFSADALTGQVVSGTGKQGHQGNLETSRSAQQPQHDPCHRAGYLLTKHCGGACANSHINRGDVWVQMQSRRVALHAQGRSPSLAEQLAAPATVVIPLDLRGMRVSELPTYRPSGGRSTGHVYL